MKEIFAEQPPGEEHWNVWLTDGQKKQTIAQINEENTTAQVSILRRQIIEISDINLVPALRELKKITDWNIKKIKIRNREKRPYTETKKNKELVQTLVEQLNKEKQFLMVKEWDKLFQFNPKSGLYEECEAEIKMECELILETDATPQVVHAILFKLKNMHLRTLKEIDKINPEEIPLKNEIFNLTTKEKRPFTSEDIYFSKLNVDRDEKGYASEILAFENTIFEGNEKKIKMFRKIIGYCFYRRMPIHKAFMFLGAGDNGKSVALSLIRAMLGEKNVSGKSMQDLGGDKFAAVHLHQKYANIDADISKITLKGADHFKKLTGEDLVTGQFKGKDGFDFVNFAKLLFSANEIPGVSEDTSERFYSRWDFLEFTRIFLPEEQDQNILQKLTTIDEMNAYTCIVLDELSDLLEDKKFCEMTDEERKNMWFKHGESSSKFATEALEASVGGAITCEMLYETYANYCRARPGTHLESNTKLIEVIRQSILGGIPRKFEYVKRRRRKNFFLGDEKFALEI